MELGERNGLPQDMWDVLSKERPPEYYEAVDEYNRINIKLHHLYDEYLAEPMVYPEVEKTPFVIWRDYQDLYKQFKANYTLRI